MEVKKCKKCGSFYNTKANYCAKCNIKIGKVYSLLEEYIENEGIDFNDYSNKEELVGRLSLGLDGVSKRDIFLGLDNKELFGKYQF